VTARGEATKPSDFISTHIMQSRSCLIRNWMVSLTKMSTVEAVKFFL